MGFSPLDNVKVLEKQKARFFKKRALLFKFIFMELNKRYPPPFAEKAKMKLKNKKPNSFPETASKEIFFEFLAERIILSIYLVVLPFIHY